MMFIFAKNIMAHMYYKRFIIRVHPKNDVTFDGMVGGVCLSDYQAQNQFWKAPIREGNSLEHGP